MPRKIGKIFSGAKSKIFGSGTSPKKSSPVSGTAASTSASDVTIGVSSTVESDLEQIESTTFGDGISDTFSTADTEPILRPSTSRDSLTFGSRSSSKQRVKSNASSNSTSSTTVRGMADGAEEKKEENAEDLNLQPIENSNQSDPNQSNSLNGIRKLFNFGPTLTSATGYNELYTEQKDLQEKSWWLSSAFNMTVGPVLFGTFDGVFITCVVHLFGVISFLRIGWLVANEGMLLASAIVFGCLLFTTISLLAAIGIMERCAAASTNNIGSTLRTVTDYGGMQQFDSEYSSSVASARANVHLLISTVLGSRIGGSISLIYCFGQAVSCALHVTGFTEAFVQLVEIYLRANPWNPDDESPNYQTRLARTIARILSIEIERKIGSNPMEILIIITPFTYQIISISAIIVLFIINIIGVKCLFRLQSLLFVSLVMAIADFMIGLFINHEEHQNRYGTIVASVDHMRQNLYPSSWSSSTIFWSRLFTVIGVFFPSAIGVMAGVNMGSDLRNPTRSIPLGSLSAIVTSYSLHIIFIIGLGVTCTREALLNDYSISQHVSAAGWFFITGLYMSALSSSLGSMYTAPRILQNLSQELHSFPIVRYFAVGRGPNKIPINALILFTFATLIFVMIGQINILAPIVTIPYLLTYATIEYAYFSMAMTFDIQIAKERRFMAIASQLHTIDDDDNEDNDDEGNDDDRVSGGGGEEQRSQRSTTPNLDSPTESTALNDNSSVSLLKIDDLVSTTGQAVPPSPTPSMQHLMGYGSVQGMTQRIKIKRRQSTKSDSETDSDDELGAFVGQRILIRKQQQAAKDQEQQQEEQEQTANTNQTKPIKAKTIRQLMAAESDDDDDDDDDDQQTFLQNETNETIETNGNLNKNCVFRFETSDIAKQSLSGTKMESEHKPETSKSVKPEPTQQQQQPVATLNSNQHDDENVTERLLNPDPELAEIACKQETWYLRLMNRWIVLIAAICKFILMFFIAWHYALVAVTFFILFYLIIGRTNPGFYPGVSEFTAIQWFKSCGYKLFRRKNGGTCSSLGGIGGTSTSSSNPNLVASYSYDRIILPPTSMPNLNYQSETLTHENSDYSSRQPYHGSTTINPQFD